MTPNIVFCITCKGRVNHVELTLPKNLADNTGYQNCKFVLVDYNSPDYLNTYIFSNHYSDIVSGRLVVYNLLPPSGSFIPFKMAHAKNMAHRLGILEGADILVNLDADNYTERGFASYVADNMDSGSYLWSQMIPGKLSRGISGRIAVTPEAFIKLGGYNEKYETWSPDDKDFNSRLHRSGYIDKRIDERFLNAVNHNDKIRFKEYKHVKAEIGEDTFEINDIGTTVANSGNVGCGVVYRNFDFSSPINIEPIPTRIFGIGMHKTATTSLHSALTILGYNSAHWKSAHWAKAIYNEMITDGWSLTLEKSYALCDLPIPVLYQRLDKAYPGSKFILTIRDDNDWIESVRRHWSPDTNPFRKEWDTDPFSHFIHKEIYGRRDFDAETFLARYRRHNDEVINYFKYRPSDLLVFNSNEWPDLCRFLKKPIPGSPYPWKHATVKE